MLSNLKYSGTKPSLNFIYDFFKGLDRRELEKVEKHSLSDELSTTNAKIVFDN